MVVLTLETPPIISRFPNSSLHQRDSRSALFEGYNGGGRSSSDATTTRRQFQTPSPSPGSVGGGYGYGGGYPGSNGNGGHLGVDNSSSRGGFRPATPNSRYVLSELFLLRLLQMPTEGGRPFLNIILYRIYKHYCPLLQIKPE